MALLLSPPSSGKTTLLLALAGRLASNLKVSGSITYNGHTLNEFIPQRTSAYVSQRDWHAAEMTVRETMEFLGRCQGIGIEYDMLMELTRREKDADVKSDEDLDLLMKAFALEGMQISLVVEYILKERLYQEIQEVCGPEKLICGPKKLTKEHLPKLPYLNVVFHETLRYHTHVPIITPRHVHEDTELGGYTILYGTYITVDLFACNMDRNVWDKPNVWDPERFLLAKSDMRDLNKTMDFGGVRRVCAGSSLAMLISTTTMGRFVQEFHWRL